MRLFDLHCDTAGECGNRGLSLKENGLHIDLKRGAQIGEYVQVFAVWIPDELRGAGAVDYFNKVSDYFYKESETNRELVSDFFDNRHTPVKTILACEGASACGGTLEGIEYLYSRGVRLVTLTWNGKNEVASGAFNEGGFTAFGREFVKKAEELGIILDASHLNRESFFELCEFSRKPFIASHSNADIVDNIYARKRNLSTEQIICIKEKGGIIGLNFCKDFIETEKEKGFDALRRQIDFFCDLGCENIIALGSDYDGCEINSELCGVEKMISVYEKLERFGYSESFLDKFFYGNAYRFFEKYCK